MRWLKLKRCPSASNQSAASFFLKKITLEQDKPILNVHDNENSQNNWRKDNQGILCSSKIYNDQDSVMLWKNRQTSKQEWRTQKQTHLVPDMEGGVTEQMWRRNGLLN